MELKKGYKQTEVGVIPEDWECESLEKYFSYISYGFTNPMPTVLDGVYMITASDIYYGKIQLDTARFTTVSAYNTLLTSKSKPRENDILLTKDGTLGRVALVGKETICINQSVAVIRPNGKVNPLFLKLLLEDDYYQKVMLENAGGSTIKHIYITIVNKMPIGIPSSVREQTAIATALSDADTLIQNLEQLIAKKQLIKQGAMQELLTPKEGWEEKTLEDVCVIIKSGGTPTSSVKTYYDGEIPFLSIGDMTTQGKYLRYTNNHISKKGIDNSASWIVPSGAVIYSMYASVGFVSINMIDIAISQAVLCLMFKKDYSSEFMYYLLLNMKAGVLKFVGEGTQKNLSAKTVKAFDIKYPHYDEQLHIANILSAMDEEIDALEQKLKKYKHIKQGMMQDLLTGKVRLV